MPSMPGITISVRRRLNLQVLLSISSACMPSSTACTEWPARSRALVMNVRMEASSSAKRIVAMGDSF